MFSILRIEGDTTSWKLRTSIEAGIVTAPSAPVALHVSEPLAGTLLLSARSVGSVVLLQPPPPTTGTTPNGMYLPEPCLYVPSTTGTDLHSHPHRYYQLPPSEDLANLQGEITRAMSEGTFVAVDVTGPDYPGVVVLNGAALPFVVLCPGTGRG